MNGLSTLSNQDLFKERYEDTNPEFRLVDPRGLRPLNWWIPIAPGPRSLELDGLVDYLLPAQPTKPPINVRRVNGFLAVGPGLELGEVTFDGFDNGSYAIRVHFSISPWWVEVVESQGMHFVTLGQDRVLAALKAGATEIPVVYLEEGDISSSEPWRLNRTALRSHSGLVIEHFLQTDLTLQVSMRNFHRMIKVTAEEIDVPLVVYGN